MTKSEKFFAEKIKEVAKAKTVLNVGAGQPWQKEMKNYKSLFADVDYKTLDKTAEYQPDIVGDVCQIPLADESIQAVICHSVLEHVADPFKAIAEIHRILVPNGQCLAVVPFLYPYHAEKGYYGDYFRFTEDGVKYVFRNFHHLEICQIRGFFGTMINLMPVKLVRKIFSPLAGALDGVLRVKKQTSGYIIYAKK
jgi:ubiquinone/menaquinone biosynthesis C-methylase UbiE